MTTTNTDTQTASDIECARPVQTGCNRRPDVDVVETSHEVTILADVPGVDSDSIDVDFDRDKLTINGKVRPRSTEKRNALRCEYPDGNFARSFRISENVDAGGITAECKDGLLTLHLPKAEAAKPHRISVSVD